MVIGHVDCSAADNINRPLCDAQGVNGFPTLHIYKDGVKASFLSGCKQLFNIDIFRLRSTMGKEILQSWRSLLRNILQLSLLRRKRRMSCKLKVLGFVGEENKILFAQ